jgi:Flp pilus assembly pilin Flp
MRSLITATYALLRDDRGEDLTEYGLLTVLIAIVAMVALGDVGLQIGDLWDRLVLEIAGIL